MGRHKKDCTCELCMSKKQAQPEPQKDTPPVATEAPSNIINDIKQSAVAETSGKAEPEVFFETTTAAETKQPQVQPQQVSPPEPSLEEKARNISFMIAPLVNGLYNIIFARMEVAKLSKAEEESLTRAWSMVLAKYSAVYEFKYKEEASLIIVNLAVFMPRLSEYNKKKQEKLKAAESSDEQKIEEAIMGAGL